MATDLARLLGSLIRDDWTLWQAAINDYREFAPLSELEISLVHALDRSGTLLSPMTWLERFLLSGTKPEVSEAAIQRLIGLAGRLHHLAWN